MSLLDKRTSVDLVKLVIFMAITAVATGLLAVVIGNLTYAPSREFKADFVNVAGVVKGDDVRVAGVKVGNVKDIEIIDRTKARLTFSVAEDVEVTEETQAAIRYRNLVGQRYLSLTGGEQGTDLTPGEVIPINRTSPALDLTVLFNGFKPLFEALSPQDVNQLSYEIVQVFQGEGGTLKGLLGHTASVTQTLANRDQVIGDLIDNLNEVLVTVGDRDDELSSLIINLRKLVGGLADDKDALLGPLDSISQLSEETASLVTGIRKPLTKDVKELRKFAGNLAEERAEIDRAMQVLPIKLNKIGRTATYGSWFNFYLCNFTGTAEVGPIGPVPINYKTDAARCSLP